MKRPDGKTAMAFGWGCLGVGVITAGFTGLVETADAFWLCVVISNLGFGIGVLLLSLGYLVQAIWFLPSREIDEAGVELHKCDYCDQKIASPAQPCSALPTADLTNVAERIDSDNCRKILGEKDFLPM